MKTYNLLKKLERMPLFTENDVSKIINKSAKYVKTLLYRLNKEGLIKRIEKGKYTIYDDAVIYASHIAVPSYISLWTALRYYNMTQQQPTSLFIMVPKKRKNINNKISAINFISTKHMFGYKKERYSDFDIFITEPEKAIIDSMLFKIPIDDIEFALNSSEIDFEKLSICANKTKNKSLIKRLGYLIEKKIGMSYNLKAEDNNYIVLDYNKKKVGKKNKKWRLIINT